MFLIKLHVLFAHNQIEKLLRETFKRDHEVNQLYFRGELGQVMRVRVPGRHVQLEFICIVDVRVTKLDLLNATNFENMLEQYWVEDRV